MNAYDGQLHLFRLDGEGDLKIGLSDTCASYDADALAYMLTWDGVSAADAFRQADEFASWWNDNDIVDMIESGADGELRDALKPFDDAGVFFEVTDLKWDLG